MEETLLNAPNMTDSEKLDLMKYQVPISYWETAAGKLLLSEKTSNVQSSIPCPKECKPLIRSKVKQGLSFQRDFNRTEKVWTNRGLPVDRKSLCSEARKDAFDMKNLKESLPSTSVSEMKTFDLLKRKAKRRADRSRLRDLHYEKVRKGATADGKLPSKEIRPLPFDLVDKEESEEYVAFRTILLNEFQSAKSPGDIQRKIIMGKKMIAEMKAPLLNQAGPSRQINGNLNVCPEFAQMSLDDNEREEKRKEMQNSDVDNKQENAKVSDCPKLHLGSGRNWPTDFLFQAARVPSNPSERNADASLNQVKSHCDSVQNTMLQQIPIPLINPNKKGASYSVRKDSFLRLELAENMHRNFSRFNYLSKLLTLKSRGGVLAKDMDKSKLDKIIEREQTFRRRFSKCPRIPNRKRMELKKRS